MGEVEEFVDLFLAHYSSQYYDPNKAHAYYLKTRELKGRRSASMLKGAKKKEAWTYAQNQIAQGKTAEAKNLAARSQADVKRLQAQAVKRGQEISDKLKALTAQMPKGSKAQPGQKEAIAKEREKVASELKSAVANARANYQTQRKNLAAKYETISQKEFDAIRTKA